MLDAAESNYSSPEDKSDVRERNRGKKLSWKLVKKKEREKVIKENSWGKSRVKEEERESVWQDRDPAISCAVVLLFRYLNWL